MRPRIRVASPARARNRRRRHRGRSRVGGGTDCHATWWRDAPAGRRFNSCAPQWFDGPGEAATAEAARLRELPPTSHFDGLSRMRTWKLKVGGGEPAAEGARVASLLAGCDALGLRLRLDANQAWDRTGVRTFCDALKAGWRQHLPRPTHVAAEGGEGEGAQGGDGGGGGGAAAGGGTCSAEATGKRRRTEAAEKGAADEDGGSDDEPMWPPACLQFCEEPLKAECLFELPAMHLTDSLPYALDESVTAVARHVRRQRCQQRAGLQAGGAAFTPVGTGLLSARPQANPPWWSWRSSHRWLLRPPPPSCPSSYVSLRIGRGARTYHDARQLPRRPECRSRPLHVRAAADGCTPARVCRGSGGRRPHRCRTGTSGARRHRRCTGRGVRTGRENDTSAMKMHRVHAVFSSNYLTLS